MKEIKSPELEYFSNNFNEICDKYKDQWICIKNNEIVGYGNSLIEANNMARNNGYKKFLTTRASKKGWNIDYVSIF
ncbi:MAG TPA: hypothetical protein DFI01_02045 [Bacteroidales bacterium]|nr:hypothetical protein [Bacteroidales bacterium]